MDRDSKKDIQVTLAVLIAIVLIVGGAIIFTKGDKTGTQSATTTPSATSAETTDATNTTATATGTAKDGTYSADGSYNSPGGTQSIGVSVTLKDGVVTATDATSKATDGEAEEYQKDFIDAYKSIVIGKKLDDIKLSRVSGSSLTSQGFNHAIEKIRSQASQG